MDSILSINSPVLEELIPLRVINQFLRQALLVRNGKLATLVGVRPRGARRVDDDDTLAYAIQKMAICDRCREAKICCVHVDIAVIGLKYGHGRVRVDADIHSRLIANSCYYIKRLAGAFFGHTIGELPDV